MLTGDSKKYYPKKAIAEEKAAENICEQLQKMKIDLPVSGKTKASTASSASSVVPATVSPPSQRIFKQCVNNHFQGKLMTDLPVYTTFPAENGFQCRITHLKFLSLIGCQNIEGNICSTKKDAENSAAWKVWTIIEDKLC